MGTTQKYQLHPLCRFAALPPKGGSEGCAEHHPQRGAARPWLPGGGAGSPQGLTCAPAGAMQASNRRQAALSESQRGCRSLNGNSSKIPTTPPLPLRGTSPNGGSEGCAEHHPQRGQRGPWLPNGGAGSPQGLTCAPAGAMQASNRRQAALSESQRGCCSLNRNSSKIPTTPPLPLRGTSPNGGSE